MKLSFRFHDTLLHLPVLLLYGCETWTLLAYSVGRASDRHAAEASSIPWLVVRRGIFLPVNFQCRLSYGVRTPPCATACINICAHVKDPVVRVRVRWIMETLKYPACTVVSTKKQRNATVCQRKGGGGALSWSWHFLIAFSCSYLLCPRALS